MEHIVENYGLSLIAVQVFQHLDDKSLCNAMLVKKSWRDLIEPEAKSRESNAAKKELITFKGRQHSISYFLKQWPEWHSIFEDFLNRTYAEVDQLLKFLEHCFHYYCHMMNTVDPLMIAMEFKYDLEFFKLVLPSIKNPNYQSPTGDRKGKTILHTAVLCGRSEMVKLIWEQHGLKINLDVQDKWGRTVLDEASVQSFKSQEKKEILNFLKQKVENKK